MKRYLLLIMCVAGLITLRANAEGGIVVPAGTIIRCTLDEANFSSATADIGDPVLCHLAGLQEFGHPVFPRGSYLAGHLEADKEPGHFVGKGYLKLQFDRIGMPDADVPMPSKIIAARGYKVDRQGDIVGKGHAKRDIAEWMIPPLWPWKVLMLPRRGPRPTLKGEEQLSLRVMEDIEVPFSHATYGRAPLSPGWRRFSPSSYPVPRSYNPPASNVAQQAAPTADGAAVSVTNAAYVAQPAGVPRDLARATTLVLKTSATYQVTDLRVEDQRVIFALPSGSLASVQVSEVDWIRTSQLSASSGARQPNPQPVPSQVSAPAVVKVGDQGQTASDQADINVLSTR